MLWATTLGPLLNSGYHSSEMTKQTETIGQDVPKGSIEDGLKFLNSFPAQCHFPDSRDEGPGSGAFRSWQV